MPNTKSDQARLNGARSQGPVTPEGKARSSRNAIKHGLNSAQVVLEHEDRAAFDAMRQAYMDRHDPFDQHEADLVETMVSARWRMNRFVTTEAQLFEKELAVREPDLKKRFSNIDPETRLSCAFENLAESRALSLLLRYESQINRTYDRAFKHLQQLQASRAGARPAAQPDLPNEPSVLQFPPPNEPKPLFQPSPEPPETPNPPSPTPNFQEETPQPTV